MCRYTLRIEWCIINNDFIGIHERRRERGRCMLTSLALIFIIGLVLSAIFKQFKLPGLLGMILTGIILGPYALNWIDTSILNASADLRQIALIIILIRAGLALDISALKKVGRPAVLMCFVPAVFEIIGITLLAPPLLGVTYIEGALIGAVVAAVSPAVIVPRMLKLMDEGYGKSKNIPQLIMAGAAVDDIFVIVLFSSFLALEEGGSFSPMSLLEVPVSIGLGAVLGVVVGLGLIKLFKRIHMRDSTKVLVMLSSAFLFIAFEHLLGPIVPISGLLAVMAMGAMIYKGYDQVAKRLSHKFNKLWVAAEVLLFVLVGATVDIKYAIGAGLGVVALILLALLFRMVGVFVALIKTPLNKKERLFCVTAYMPKATVQAAIGGIPLAKGLAVGNVVLTVAVIAIIITAPLGALGIDLFYKKLLEKK